MDHDIAISMPSTSRCSKPLHIQRLEQALDLSVLNQLPSKILEDSEEEDVFYDTGETYVSSWDDILKDCDDGENPLVNPDSMDLERNWLTEILLDDTCDSVVDEPIHEINSLMKLHNKHKKIVANTPPEVLEQHMYYGAGLLSNFDKYPENKKVLQGKKRKRDEEMHLKNLYAADPYHDLQDEGFDLEPENSLDIHGMIEDEVPIKIEHPIKAAGAGRKNKSKKFKDEESKRKWEEMMYLKRRKMFSNMIKKEVGKQQRAKVNRHKEVLLQTKKLALACQKIQRLKALQSARTVKELQWRMKRLTRENMAYWKRSKRVDREIRRKLEKEAEEQRKIDFELVEAKRQQRKLNFLITQTELYAHFMSKKLGDSSPEEQLRILNQLDEEKNPRLSSIDDYDCDVMKAKAIRNAHDAFKNEKARTRQFDKDEAGEVKQERKSLDVGDGEFPQPTIFKGILKVYQLRGMNWLANLYDQGISGILADEMGLGKTVQSIAFLSHLAEVQDLWGPFLVICPASTLHNWQSEFEKFVPSFKVVPYWGNPADRKILRQFWHQDGMHTKDAGFHVVITSYQIVISDVKYFNRIKWQYMVLDEAQAIKSTSSMRWKILLGFNCRNRLLLSGTPIQNSMAELWALLHFIMPTLFDSHEEFNEWFSKDIESHAENKTGIDEKHLSRLHMILKPFMLRRIKKDVENELSDKIEIMVYCPLTTRQRLLYMALKQKIHIEDLLHYTVGGGDSHSVDKNFTSNLMNLVMQFRKVCNHPELFERRDAKSPIHLSPIVYQVPYLVYDCNVRYDRWLSMKKQFLFSNNHIAQSKSDPDSLFHLDLGLSSGELGAILSGDLVMRWKCYFDALSTLRKHYHRVIWSRTFSKLTLLMGVLKICEPSVQQSNVLQEMLFTWKNTASRIYYTFLDHYYHSMPETIEHRNIRCRTNGAEPSLVAPEFVFVERKPQVFFCERTELPSFLLCATLKVSSQAPVMYCYSRRAAYDYTKHLDDWSWTALYQKWTDATGNELAFRQNKLYPCLPASPIDVVTPLNGWSNILIPDKETLVTDSGKLYVLDGLLRKLKEEGHRVLIYSQMTKMIDLLEEYMWHRHHKYMRLDGSSKISERRDMVADFQARTDIFVFLLSTRAGGLGINLTAADTVIFYDSDWNPTVDQQAMDRAHRLGQTKQVTVYRLICKGSIEERILQRAREKSEIQNLVISGGNFKPETLKPKEVVSLLLDDEEIELKYRQRAEERKHLEDMREMDRKRKYQASQKNSQAAVAVEKRVKQEGPQEGVGADETWLNVDSVMSSPHSENSADIVSTSDDLTDGSILDMDSWETGAKLGMFNSSGIKSRAPGRGSSKRGRPRGSRRISALGRFNATTMPTPATTNVTDAAPAEPAPSTSSVFTPYETPSGSVQSGIGSITTTSNPAVRRGPGRPRLKPGGPTNTGSRGTYRPRKPARPLPVPLPSDASVNASSYSYFNFPEQTDS